MPIYGFLGVHVTFGMSSRTKHWMLVFSLCPFTASVTIVIRAIVH